MTDLDPDEYERRLRDLLATYRSNPSMVPMPERPTNPAHLERWLLFVRLTAKRNAKTKYAQLTPEEREWATTKLIELLTNLPKGG